MKNGKKCLIGFFITITVCGLTVFSVNFYVDPMWYFDGNQFRGNWEEGLNLTFDERRQKINRFLKNPKNYDCIIFGDSGATSYPENDFENYNCFNLSFSGANPNEILAYGKYVKKFGGPIKLIVVESSVIMLGLELPYRVPEFIEKLERPVSWVKKYFTFSIFRMSLISIAETFKKRSQFYRIRSNSNYAWI